MWLDQIAEAIAANPASALALVLIAGFGVISPDIVLIGLAGFVVLKGVRQAHWYLIAAGVVSLLALYCCSVPFSAYRSIGHYAWSALIHNHWLILTNRWVLLTALPLGLFMSALLIVISRFNSHLGKEVKRLGKGKLAHKQASLSEKRISKRLAAIESAATPEGSVLGVCTQTGRPVTLTDKNANLHTLAIGTTGSGKTTAISNIIESAIVRGLPIIIVDGKGDIELMKKVSVFAELHKRPFYGFSMIGNSVKYNPLSSGGITSKKDRIIELRQWSEDHYRKIAEGYLQTVFEIIERAGIHVDLFQLAQYLEIPALRDLVREIKDEALANKLKKLASTSEDIGSLKAEIENLANSEIGHLFNCQEGRILSLPDALAQNAVIYFCLQPLAFPAYANCLGKLIINDIKSLAASQLRSTDKKKIYTIFDEFSVFAGEQIVNLINQGRSAGIHAILSTQSLSDLSAAGGQAFVGQVLNNCNNYLIQRQNNPDDAETLAQVVGTKDGFEFTSQLSTATGSTRAGSVKAVKEYLIHPDEIKRLGVGMAYYIDKLAFQYQELRIRHS